MKKQLLSILLLCTLLIGTSYAQSRTITGQVTSSDDGAALPGVSVKAMNTTAGTQTNANGVYSLSVPSEAQSVTFSYIGFNPQTVTIGSATTINVILTVESSELSEVIVNVAYGKQRLATFTGSASQIGSDKFESRPITNVLDALTGQASGVSSTGGNGQPGTGASIRVRGIGSINASSTPLYVLDGVPYSGDIGSINPADIDNVTILKDASTAAMYGSRGANGVIMITTKKGKQGQRVTISGMQGFSERGIKEYERVGPEDYYPLMWEAYRNSLALSGDTPMDEANALASKNIKTNLGYNPFNVPDDQIVGLDGKLNPNASLLYADDLDWSSPLLRTGIRGDYNLSVSGANDKTDYFVSLGYLTDKGFSIRSDFDRITGRINVNTQATPWFRTGLNLSANMTESQQARDESSTGYVNPFYFARNIGPIYPVHAHDPITGTYLLDEKGERIYDLGSMTDLGLPTRPSGASPGRHIVAETNLNNDLFTQNVLGGRTFAEITFLKDFTFTTNISVDVKTRLVEGYDNYVVGDGAPAGRANRENTITKSVTFNQLLNYNKEVEKHHFDMLVGHENYDWKYDYLYGFKQGIVVDGNYELGNFTEINSLTSRKDMYRVESYFSRFSYDYDERYLFSASYRTDASSRFAKDKRWGNFWSAGAGWRIDNEEFLKSYTWIDMLKLRASYGQLGNDDVNDYYAWQALYTIGVNNAEEPGFIQRKLASDLVWESNNSFDIGLEFGLFNSRLNGTIEYFQRQTNNLLFEVPLPLSSGLETQFANIGGMYNKGFEFDLWGDVIRRQDFNWNLRLNATFVKNRVTELPQEEIIDGTKKRMVGRGVYDFWLRQWYGVDPNNGAGLFYADDIGADDVYELNGEMVTENHNNALYAYNGSSLPKLSGGIVNDFKYKRFALSILLDYQLGGKVYDGTYASLMGSGNYGSSMHIDMLNRWQKPGDVSDIPRVDVTSGKRSAWGAQSNRWLIDGSYLNIRSVNFSYDIPPSILSKLTLNKAKVFVTGDNLALFSHREGTNVAQQFNGVTSNVYVPARTLTFGLNVTL